jgi:hypothetical protein
MRSSITYVFEQVNTNVIGCGKKMPAVRGLLLWYCWASVARLSLAETWPGYSLGRRLAVGTDVVDSIFEASQINILFNRPSNERMNTRPQSLPVIGPVEVVA